jgi:hypothetical protein
MITLLLHLFRLLAVLCGSHRPPRPREPRLAPAARCLQEDAPAAEATSERPTLLGFPIPGVGRVAPGPDHRDARHRAPLAPTPFPRLLGQAVEEPPRWAAVGQRRDRCPRPQDGRRQSAMGCASNSWRASEARYRGSRAYRLSVDPEALDTSFTDLAHVHREPCPGSGVDRLLHRSHCSVARALRPGRARSPSAPLALQHHRPSYCGVDRSADRGHRSPTTPPLPISSRSRRDLRRRVPPARGGHGDPRSPHGCAEPVAESPRRTPDRIDQARLPRPRHRPKRAPPASRPDWLFRVLPPHPNPPFPHQGCIGSEAGRAAGAGQGRAHPRSRWPASSIHPASGIAAFRPAQAHHRLCNYSHVMRAPRDLPAMGVATPRFETRRHPPHRVPWRVVTPHFVQRRAARSASG